jgi:DNA-directed RNA polymerase subunit omega
MNSELCKKALEKVGNPNTLINLISRRVRQLNGGGSGGRPLVSDSTLGAADTALLEIVEDKMGWEVSDENLLVIEAPRKRKRH